MKKMKETGTEKVVEKVLGKKYKKTSTKSPKNSVEIPHYKY